MEGLKKAIGDAMGKHQDYAVSKAAAAATTAQISPYSLNSTSPSSDQSRILLNRSPRQVVSLWTCSKLCAFCFVTGIVVGYTLKRRVRRWASRILRRLKDD